MSESSSKASPPAEEPRAAAIGARRVLSSPPQGTAAMLAVPDATTAVWAGAHKAAPEAFVVEFCAGRDVRARPAADTLLIPYDLWTNAAHALMLHRQKVLDAATTRAILDGLATLEARFHAGDFALDPALEDVHFNIERAVAAIAGEAAAGRMHTGRSRNDQSATDMRLWLRDQILAVEDEALALVDALLARAGDWAALPLPGYTHQQPGMVSSLGLWAAAHAQALLRDVVRLRQAYEAADICPLGAAAGFGTSWPLDRQYAAHLLGFVEVQGVALDCVTNRWEAEATAAQAFAFLLTHLSILAQDLIVFSSPPRRFLDLPERFTTGSSIMPQKRNPDFAEVIRAKAAHVQGHLAALLGQARGMISGYNRDTQWSKYAALDAADETRGAARVLALVIEAVAPRADEMRAACAEGFLNAVEVADFLARERRLSFREAYGVVGKAVAACRETGTLTREAVEEALRAQGHQAMIDETSWQRLSDPAALLEARRTEGSPNPARLAESVRNLREHWSECQTVHRRRVVWLERATQTLRRLHGELATAGQ